MNRPEWDLDDHLGEPQPYLGDGRELRPAAIAALFGFGFLVGYFITFHLIPWLVERGVG